MIKGVEIQALRVCIELTKDQRKRLTKLRGDDVRAALPLASDVDWEYGPQIFIEVRGRTFEELQVTVEAVQDQLYILLGPPPKKQVP